LTHLRWREVDLRQGLINLGTSKTDAGPREIVIEPELAQLLREHKIASRWSRPEDFVFPGRTRTKPRERNSVRTRVLYGAIAKADELLAEEGLSPLPEGITFHSLRRTYAALRAEQGEHPAVTAAQMGHVDPRMTLRIYTDVTGMRPKTRLGALLRDVDWALMGTGAISRTTRARKRALQRRRKRADLQALLRAGATGLEPATSGVTGLCPSGDRSRYRAGSGGRKARFVAKM
jgi:hypothetical protein